MAIKRIGDLRFYDTSLNIWEEAVAEPEFTDRVFTPLRSYLKRRGFAISRDPQGKRYPSIAKWMWLAKLGDLQCKLHLGGRHIEITFFQNVVYENPNGGQHDFHKFAKMPFLIRQRFLVEVGRLISYLNDRHGYNGPPLAGKGINPLLIRLARTARYGHQARPTEDPLQSFNDGWDGEFDKKQGEHRFERDETGWPTRREVTSGNAGGRDREGVYVEPGTVRYWRHWSGHVFRGRAYPNMNSMCVFVYGPGPQDYTQIGSWELFTPRPGESLRRDASARRVKALQRHLARAVAEQRVEKAVILRDLLNKPAVARAGEAAA